LLLIQPDDAEVLLNYGHALSGDGQFEKAIEAYQRALQNQPEFVDAQISLAKALT
jgi:cytochrome c-type biogenesis protein CcmH/NrfG